MKRKIVADSSCDIWELNGVDFAVAPMTISTDNKHYVDNQELDVHLMSEDLAKYKGVSHTACPSAGHEGRYHISKTSPMHFHNPMLSPLNHTFPGRYNAN